MGDKILRSTCYGKFNKYLLDVKITSNQIDGNLKIKDCLDFGK